MLDRATGYILWSLKFTEINNYTCSLAQLISYLSLQWHHFVWPHSEGRLPGPSGDSPCGTCTLNVLSEGTGGSSDNGSGLLTWGPCLWFCQRHRDRQLLQACLCICKYPYTPSEPWEQSGHLPQIQCMSHPYSSITDGAGVPTGHRCPSLKHADHPRAAVLSLWELPILWLWKIERTVQMKCCPIVPCS